MLYIVCTHTCIIPIHSYVVIYILNVYYNENGIILFIILVTFFPTMIASTVFIIKLPLQCDFLKLHMMYHDLIN